MHGLIYADRALLGRGAPACRQQRLAHLPCRRRARARRRGGAPGMHGTDGPCRRCLLPCIAVETGRDCGVQLHAESHGQLICRLLAAGAVTVVGCGARCVAGAGAHGPISNSVASISAAVRQAR
jgi:hypothetical protein